MTYRERREARAERLTEWAAKREAKAEAAFDQASKMAGLIPFGQPMMPGHYSYGRDRNYRDRIYAAGARGIDHARKAESMASRAATIEAQLAASIYDDDPDAIERLTERIATLEAQRDRIKAENAAFRKAHRATFAGLTPYERDHAMPHRGYVLTNLTGNIKRNRDRLANLTRKAGQS